jgi:hypothetical protein
MNIPLIAEQSDGISKTFIIASPVRSERSTTAYKDNLGVVTIARVRYTVEELLTDVNPRCWINEGEVLRIKVKRYFGETF